MALDDAESEHIAVDPFFVVCTHDHRLASLTAVRLSDMASDDLLLLEDGHCMREHALAACHLEGARRNALLQGTSLYTLVQMGARRSVAARRGRLRAERPGGGVGAVPTP